MRDFNVIVTLNGVEQKSYHITIMPSDFPGGALPFKEFSTFGEFRDAASELGISCETIEAISVRLVHSSRTVMLRQAISDESATTFGWPAEEQPSSN